jgi:hypothetical protein
LKIQKARLRESRFYATINPIWTEIGADWSVFGRSEPDFGPFFTVPTTIQPILLLQLDAQKNLEESGNFFFMPLMCNL